MSCQVSGGQDRDMVDRFVCFTAVDLELCVTRLMLKGVGLGASASRLSW